MSNTHDGIGADPPIAAAAHALAAGDALAALKQVALREDADGLCLRGMAMAQLGDLVRARKLLRRAAHRFGAKAPLARARCRLAAAEIALASRDLVQSGKVLPKIRATLDALADRTNAAHAGYLEARRRLLLGRLAEAAEILNGLDHAVTSQATHVGCELVTAGIAMRRIHAASARAALERAMRAARATGIAPLVAEVDQALQALDAPAACLLQQHGDQMLRLDQVEALLASGTLIVDACRNTVHAGTTTVSLAGRPVLFAIAGMLARAWPHDVPRDVLLVRVFRIRDVDASQRVRLRVEIGRLRQALRPLAAVNATANGFVLEPHLATAAALLVPPVESGHARLLALLADGEAWSSSALALALGSSSRTVQRALAALDRSGAVEAVGHGRARRWIARRVPGLPTSLLLPAPEPGAVE